MKYWPTRRCAECLKIHFSFVEKASDFRARPILGELLYEEIFSNLLHILYGVTSSKQLFLYYRVILSNELLLYYGETSSTLLNLT